MSEGCEPNRLSSGAFGQVTGVINQANSVATTQLGSLKSAVSQLSSAASSAISALSHTFSPPDVTWGEADFERPEFVGSYAPTELVIPPPLEDSRLLEIQTELDSPPTPRYGSPPSNVPSINITEPPPDRFSGNMPTYKGPFEPSVRPPAGVTLVPPQLVGGIEAPNNITYVVDFPIVPKKPIINSPVSVGPPGVEEPERPELLPLAPISFDSKAPQIDPITLGGPGFGAYQPSLGGPGFGAYQPSLGGPGFGAYQPSLGGPGFTYQAGQLHPESLSFGEAPSFGGLQLPSLGGLAPPSVYSPSSVELTEPSANTVLAKFDATVNARPGDPNFSFASPDFNWVVSRLDITPPTPPSVNVGDINVDRAVGLIENLIDDTIERPSLSYTPIDLTITPLGDPPDTSGIGEAASALQNFIPHWKSLVDDSRNDILNSASQHLNQQSLAPIITALKERVGGFLSTDEDRIGLPVAVENAMRERAFAGIDKETLKLERQAVEEWLARGFTIPAGPLNSQIMVLRQSALDKRHELSRDIFIESSKIKLENLWNAIKTGIEYEFKYREESFKAQEIALGFLDAQVKAYSAVIDAMAKSANTTLDIWRGYIQLDELRAKVVQVRADAEKTINEGKIAIYQADASVIATRAGTIGELIKANLAEAEVEKIRATSLTDLYKAEGGVYSAQMDANAKLISLPALEADLEKARLSAVSDEYKSKMDGWKTQLQLLPDAVKVELAKVDISKARIDNERLKVESSELNVRSYTTEVESTKALIGAETAKVQAYQAEVEGYRARVSGETTKIQNFQGLVELEKAKVQAFQTNIQGYLGQIDLEKAKVQASQVDIQGYLGQVDLEKAKVQASQTDMQGYLGQVDLEKAKVQASQTDMQGYLGKVDLEKAKAQIAQVKAQNYQADVQLKSAQAELEKTKAQIFQAGVQQYQAGVELQNAITNQYKIQVDEQRLALEEQNLKVQAFQQEASVFSGQVNLEELKLKGKDIELRSEGFKIDNNKLKLAKYEADTQYQKLRADYFGQEVQAYAAAIQEVAAKNAAFKAEIEGFAAQMQGYAEEMRGYVAKNQGETAKAQVFAAEVENYGNAVRGYTAEVQGFSAEASALTGIEQARLQAVGQQMQASLAFVEKQVQQNRNLLTQYEVDSKMFLEDVALKKMQGEFEISKLSANVQNQIKLIQISAKEHEILITKASEMARILISAMDGVARAHGQAAAGAMGMVNVGATLSAGATESNQYSCQNEFRWEMSV
jgi:hypothetical protein